LPSFSFCCFCLWAAAVRHDGIISALHVFDSSSEAVAICWVGACGTGVGFVEAQSMCPAVVHGDAIIGGNSCQGGSLGESGGHCGFAVWRGSQFVAQNSGSIGSMEPTLASCEFAEAFLVFSGEENVKVSEGFVSSQVDAPHVTRHGEDASGFEEEESQINDGLVGDGVTSNSGNALDFTETFPEQFDGISWGPQSCNAGLVGFQFGMSDGVKTVQSPLTLLLINHCGPQWSLFS